MNEQQANEIWSKNGYNPQIFPYYNAAGSARFLDSQGQSNAVEGAKTNITYSIDAFPIMLIGLRVEVIWPIVEDPTADEIELYRITKEIVDPAMTIELKLTSQSIVGKPIPIKSLQGADGFIWHNFASPYMMAGSNTVELYFTRLTSYPLIRDERIEPTLYATLVTQQMRADRVSVATTRREMPR